MHTLKLGIVLMFAANVLMLGMEASKARDDGSSDTDRPAEPEPNLPEIVMRAELPEAQVDLGLPACYTVGPFESAETARAILELLSGNGYEGRTRQTVAFVDRGFWVYLPPFDSELSARQALDALYRAGLEDIALMRSGDWDRSVSLGYFINQANALARREQAQALGFDAEIRIQREDEARHWVDYQVPGQGKVEGDSLLADLVPAELHREVACALPGEAVPGVQERQVRMPEASLNGPAEH